MDESIQPYRYHFEYSIKHNKKHFGNHSKQHRGKLYHTTRNTIPFHTITQHHIDSSPTHSHTTSLPHSHPLSLPLPPYLGGINLRIPLQHVFPPRLALLVQSDNDLVVSVCGVFSVMFSSVFATYICTEVNIE